MTEKETLSFITINIFIERGYLESVLEQILVSKRELGREDQIAFEKAFRKYVSILGFRNPLRAPRPLQINGYASSFEEKEEVVPFTLSTWAKLNQDLANQVKDWLKSEDWEDLTLERYYEDSEGFSSDWPEDLTIDKLIEKFEEDNPDVEFDRNDLTLMIIWVSGKLPPTQSEL